MEAIASRLEDNSNVGWVDLTFAGGLENPMPRMRLSAAGQRTSVDGVPQIGAHYVLAFL